MNFFFFDLSLRRLIITSNIAAFRESLLSNNRESSNQSREYVRSTRTELRTRGQKLAESRFLFALERATLQSIFARATSFLSTIHFSLLSDRRSRTCELDFINCTTWLVRSYIRSFVSFVLPCDFRDKTLGTVQPFFRPIQFSRVGITDWNICLTNKHRQKERERDRG